MNRKEKKAKAAAIAVACFVQLESNCKENNSCYNWQRINKLFIMQKRGLLQLKGRVPGNFRLRL